MASRAFALLSAFALILVPASASADTLLRGSAAQSNEKKDLPAPVASADQIKLSASSSGALPSWCSHVPAASQQYVTDCGGTGSTGSSSGSIPSWCDDIPEVGRQHVADCAGTSSGSSGSSSSVSEGSSTSATSFCIPGVQQVKSCDACCNTPDSYCVAQKCWMCQKDKTSANCANCWAQKCMPECTKCYDFGSSSSSSVSEGSGRSPRGASIEGSGNDTSPISAGWSVAGGKGWVVTALSSCASLLAGLHMGTA